MLFALLSLYAVHLIKLNGGTDKIFAELLLLDGFETLKTYVAQGGENILVSDEVGFSAGGDRD